MRIRLRGDGRVLGCDARNCARPEEAAGDSRSADRSGEPDMRSVVDVL